jgi:alpha-galactosidase
MMARQDRSSTTLGEARVSILTGIVTGVALTSDNLDTIAPERLALLSRAATIRMRDARPVDFKLWGHPSVFAGTVDGRRAAAAINETETAREFAFEALTLDPAREAEEILHPLGARKYTVTVPPHDAVLLVQSA